MKITVRNKDEKRPVVRLNKVFAAKSTTTLEVSETDYRVLRAVRRLEVQEVKVTAPATGGKTPRKGAKVQPADGEPAATGADIEDEESGDNAGDKE